MAYTRERESTDYLSGLMSQKSQKEVADNLVKFNKSEDLMPLLFSTDIWVRPTNMLMSGGSNRFEMHGALRGYCLIIVNDPDMVPQAKQVESVFRQMLFTVELKEMVPKIEMKELFSSLTSNKNLEDHNSLVTYLLGHGCNGYFGAKDGKVSIPELLDSCAKKETEDYYFDDKPIIHIIDCCRIRKLLSKEDFFFKK